jgi:hypothetical protein
MGMQELDDAENFMGWGDDEPMWGYDGDAF